MDEFDKQAFVGAIILTIVIIIVIYFIVKGLMHIQEVGLKTIVESIWEGKG